MIGTLKCTLKLEDNIQKDAKEIVCEFVN